MGDFSEDLKKSNIIFVIGGPGSGKGTQCNKLAEKYGFTHLSTEDLLQREMSSSTERSKIIRVAMESGKLVPGDIITELLKEAIVANMEDTKGFLIDGYPQNVKQGEEFEHQIGEPSLVLCMDCSSKTMSSRLLKRSQSSQCLDDNAEIIMKRIETYYEENEPVIIYYENKIPLFKINADGTPEEVFLEACSSIDTFLEKERTASFSVHTV
ncbi:adenylate kinase isoenzyme 5 isoform X2 [Hemicordylus capensis]|nr:adenylate kinase isoenzyme 5 isoform X2 [Hemicordylus capensis]